MSAADVGRLTNIEYHQNCQISLLNGTIAKITCYQNPHKKISPVYLSQMLVRRPTSAGNASSTGGRKNNFPAIASHRIGKIVILSFKTTCYEKNMFIAYPAYGFIDYKRW